MRGQYEESPDEKASNALKARARRYASLYLVDMFGPDITSAVSALQMAATDYADAVSAPKKRKASSAWCRRARFLEDVLRQVKKQVNAGAPARDTAQMINVALAVGSEVST